MSNATTMYFVFDPTINIIDHVKSTLMAYCPPTIKYIYSPVEDTLVGYRPGFNYFDYRRMPLYNDELKYADEKDYGEREDKLRSLENCFKPNTNRMVYREIRPGSDFTTKFKPNETCLFVISKLGLHKFATIVSLDNKSVYRCGSKPGRFINYNSKKITDEEMMIDNVMLNDVDEESGPSGCIFIHAYNKMALKDILDSEPYICIVDNSYNFTTVNILNLNLSDLDSNKVAVARFEVDMRGRRIKWYIPDVPIEFKDNDHVSGSSKSYPSQCISPQDFKISNLYRFTYSNLDVLQLTRFDKILITQKSVLNNVPNVLFLSEYISTPLKYTFHRDVQHIDQYSQNSEYVDPRLALPIGGLSILSGNNSILKLCKSPIDDKACQALLHYLKSEYTKTPTVIVTVSDQYLHGNTPHMHSKLNGIFIVVYSGSGNDIKKILKEMNTGMAEVLQGPISVTLACIDNQLYFMRGVWNLKFGDLVNFDLQFSLQSPLYVPVRSPQPLYLYEKIIGYWPPLQDGYESFLENVAQKCSNREQIQFILGQLETIIEPHEFVNLKLAGRRLYNGQLYIFNVLETMIPTRGCYGKRGRGEEKDLIFFQNKRC